MQELVYRTSIAAPAEHVWRTMIGADTYPVWTRPFSPDSEYRGTWAQGESIDFIDPGRGGTRAVLDVFEPVRRILARHVAVLDAEGREQPDSEFAEQWIGTLEEYRLEETDGRTALEVRMELHPEAGMAGMFEESWPAALRELKNLCEKG